MKTNGIKNYFSKWKGYKRSPPRVPFSEIFWSWIGAFLGIGLVALLHKHFFEPKDLVFIIGSFGASAVLIYAAITSPLAQPRNLVGGHFFSGIVGVTCYKMFSEDIVLASALAVSLAIAVMHLTKTLHPPGGATALIAVIGGENIHNLGYMYAIVPATTGALVMLIVALIVNNIPSSRRYPEYWM